VRIQGQDGSAEVVMRSSTLTATVLIPPGHAHGQEVGVTLAMAGTAESAAPP
jgi:hypothetical protein